MATSIYEKIKFSLIDGTVIEAGPLKIKYLREFLEIFETIKEAKSDDESISVLVAHRLATVRKADLVIYMQDGRIKTKGSFEQVRQEVPDFDTQAQLMGL